jgi:hypothetical protein
MGTTDGYVSASSKVVDHGSNTERFNLVILGDGYQVNELTKYSTDVQTFIGKLNSTAPYAGIWTAINIFRVDVVSTDSGVRDPATCGDGSTGSGSTPKTYFDSTFCTAGIRRLLTCDSASARNVAVKQVPEVHMTMVIVNTPEYGGSGGQVAVFSAHQDAAEIALHEMGHTAFGFADEYGYYQGCGSGETGHDQYNSSEPHEPNVTANTNKSTLKWRKHLTNPSDTLPTTTNANCSDCDSQQNPKAAGYVGAYEGARYYHCGCYRPSFNCRMRELGQPFCAVCQDVIVTTLTPFLPPVIAEVSSAAPARAKPESVG